MSIRVISVGKRLPGWVYETFADYNKRLPTHYKLELTEVTAASGKRTDSTQSGLRKEADAIIGKVSDGDFVVLLDEHGKQFSSMQIAENLEKWAASGKAICFVIGGADGVDDVLRTRADITMSMSKLTFPHALVRVILAEQIYRAWSIQQNHPYHRE